MRLDSLPPLSPGLTRHSVLLCLNRQDQAIPLKAVLERAGFDVEVALSIYAACDLLDNFMPHVLLTEAVFKDGDVSRLRQQMLAIDVISQTPAIALIPDKSEKYLRPLKNFMWDAIRVGSLDHSAILANLYKIVRQFNHGSPFVRPISDLGISPQMIVRFPAEALGHIGERVVFRSAAMVDHEAVLKCVPEEKKSSFVELHCGTNLRASDSFFNVFPFSQQRGPGRAWVKSLPKISLDIDGRKSARKIIWQEVNSDTFRQFKKLMRAYNIELIQVPHAEDVVAQLAESPDGFASAFMQETEDNQRPDRVSILSSLLSIKGRPNVVIVSKFPAPHVDPTIRYLPFPIGLGRLLNAIEASMDRPGIYQRLEKEAQTRYVKCSYLIQAEAIALDEVGGILFSPYPMMPGSRFLWDNEQLTNLWGDHPELEVTSCMRDPRFWERWQIHFARKTAGASRLKYWQKLATE